MTILLPILILIILAFCARYITQRRARTRLLDTPLSDAEWNSITKQVPLIAKLPTHLRPTLAGKINVFLEQVEFHGANDLDVTTDMELSIAAQACMMVVNNDQWYDTLQTIVIYPNAFKSTQTERDGYIVRNVETIRLGESWERGPVILSWAHSKQGAFNDVDGHNVVLHEFAHQLDGLTGNTNGAPNLARGHDFDDWVQTLNASYTTLIKRVENGQSTFLDAYGATAPAEFFAVAVEVFFEQPKQLQKNEPEVYAQMQKYFQLDPATW